MPGIKRYFPMIYTPRCRRFVSTTLSNPRQRRRRRWTRCHSWPFCCEGGATLGVPDPPRRPLLQEQVSLQDQRRGLALSPRCRVQGGPRGRERGSGVLLSHRPPPASWPAACGCPPGPRSCASARRSRPSPPLWGGSRAPGFRRRFDGLSAEAKLRRVPREFPPDHPGGSG
jgi:hypothetical protein